MFKPFCLIVHLIPRIVEEIMEETLQQTMVAKNLQGAPPAVCGQTRAVVLLISHKRRFLCCKLLEHFSNGSSTDTKMLSKGVAGHPFLFRAAQLEYRFQIVIYRLCRIRSV